VELVEQIMPEISSLRIVVDTGAGNMGEDTHAFLHQCESGELGSVDEGRPSELGSTTDCGGFVRIFPDYEENGEFFIVNLICSDRDRVGAGHVVAASTRSG
jgi:hypothetical protein